MSSSHGNIINKNVKLLLFQSNFIHMATLLTKDVKRETLAITDMKGNKMIVTLKAGDMLDFRPKGKRYSYEVPLGACLNLAMIYTAHERYKERIKRYEQGKSEGRNQNKCQKYLMQNSMKH
jgi:hypothetical protein